MKPTILIVHGSFHSPNHFFPLRLLLHDAGYETECPTLPTYNSLKLRNQLAEDAACVATAARALLDRGKDVIVAMHSYGGLVGSEAITEDMTKARRAEAGLEGGVVHLLYLCAYVVPLGKTAAETMLGKEGMTAPVADSVSIVSAV